VSYDGENEKKKGKMMSMFRFNFLKALQSVGVLLKDAPNRTASRLRILKILYLSDRKALSDFGRPITGDQPFAMKNGPVLTSIYNLIKGEHPKSPEWSKFIGNQNYSIFLIQDPGISELSRYEIRKLNEVWNEYIDQDDYDISEMTHEFPEWRNHNPGTSSEVIPFEDVLKAVGKSDEEIEIIRAEVQEENAIDQLFKANV
jgi:uncharacterized phage-associated protein